MESFLHAVQQPVFGPVSWAELIGDVTGIWCVWLLARQKLLNWPIGILNNAFFFLLFWSAKLYGDAVLQTVFATLGAYGWWTWTRHPQGRADAVPVRRITPAEWSVIAAATAAATVGAAFWLARHTDSPVPIWDACVLCLSLAATYGQARKLLESWWIWIAVDVLSVPLYIRRGLYPTALLYGIFLALCIGGLRAWSRDLAQSATERAQA
jgi:nicotinamide mononucleotide transporter